MTLRKITEQRVNYKLCVAEGTFSKNLKNIKRSRNNFENCAKVYCFIVYEKTADYFVGESWIWMGFVVRNRFVVNYLSKDLASNLKKNLNQSCSFLEKKQTTNNLAMFQKLIYIHTVFWKIKIKKLIFSMKWIGRHTRE